MRIAPILRARSARWRMLLTAGLCLAATLASRADEVLLQNGVSYSGTVLDVSGLNTATAQHHGGGVVPNVPYRMIDDGVRRIFVHRRNVQQLLENSELASALVTYEIEHPRQARAAGFGKVGRFRNEPFNEFGRRTITLGTGKGDVAVVQAITELNPRWARVVSLTHNWECAVDTSTLSEAAIRGLLSHAKGANPNDARERQALVAFFLKARLYPAALEELKTLPQKFPELADYATTLRAQIAELDGQRALAEIKLRRLAGQHELAWFIAQRFPEEEVSIETLREAREIVQEYQEFREQRELVSMQLDILQSEVPADGAQRLRTLRKILEGELGYESLPRLTPFLRGLDDASLSAEEKLALAYSGWVLGSEHAVTRLDDALRLWDARFLALEFLRNTADPRRDEEILAQLRNVEGINAERLAWMLPLLSLPVDPAAAPPGEVAEITVPTSGEEAPTHYSLLLPPEYSPLHQYPLLVALRPEGVTPAAATALWAGTAAQPGWAQRRGYIVIAPEFAAANAGEYYPNAAAHEVVLRCIDDVRRRWRVDSDRIFVAGHGMGADLCFELGTAHPGRFAGCVPVGGGCNNLTRYYWDNDPLLSWYVVAGELEDKKSIKTNGGVLDNMMERGRQDVICVEYQQRGSEPYFEEQERIFRWMESRRRAPLSEVREFSAKSLRSVDDTFHWLRAREFSPRLFSPIPWDVPNRPAPRSVVISGGVKQNNVIRITHPGSATTLWLSPDLVDFNERCEVIKGSRTLSREFPQPSLQVMLEELRSHGDRERLWWARLELN